MEEMQKNLLSEVSGLHGIPVGAYNIRVDGQALSMNSTANIEIVKKKDKSGIDIYFACSVASSKSAYAQYVKNSLNNLNLGM